MKIESTEEVTLSEILHTTKSHTLILMFLINIQLFSLTQDPELGGAGGHAVGVTGHTLVHPSLVPLDSGNGEGVSR